MEKGRKEGLKDERKEGRGKGKEEETKKRGKRTEKGRGGVLIPNPPPLLVCDNTLL